MFCAAAVSAVHLLMKQVELSPYLNEQYT